MREVPFKARHLASAIDGELNAEAFTTRKTCNSNNLSGTQIGVQRTYLRAKNLGARL